MNETVSKSLDNIRWYLESKSVKPSYQRLKILEYLIKNSNHPSADVIYQTLCKEIPTLSKTTVYNTLSLFAEKGIAVALAIVNNEMRYDFIEIPHAHFHCTNCGEVIDIPIDEKLPTHNSLDEYQVEEIQISYKGVCKKCLEIDVEKIIQ